ncbi:MAG: HD domain-containing protein [Thermodesulfobacteriota bacterium]
MPNHESAITEIVKQFFLAAQGSHDWEHTRRVVDLTRTIGALEGADMAVAVTGALLHDIGRCHQDNAGGALCHAQKGADLAVAILEQFDFSANQIKNIVHCIAAHRFRKPPEPETLEARVVFDADKLDAIGAIGIARAYLFAGELGACLHNPEIDVTLAPSYSVNDTGYREYLVKLRWIKDRMLTAAGREMARQRHEFMELFFSRFLAEYEGKK